MAGETTLGLRGVLGAGRAAPVVAAIERRLNAAPAGVLAGAAAAGLTGLLAGANPAMAAAAVLGLVAASGMVLNLTAAVCAFAVVAYLEMVPRLGGAVSLAKLAGVLVVASWLAALARRRAGGFTAEQPLLTAVLLGLVSWSALSLLWAESLGDGLESMQRLFPNLALFPIVYAAVRLRRHVGTVLAMLAFGAVLAGAYALTHPDAVADGERLSGAGLNPNQLGAMLLVGAVSCGALAAGMVPRVALRVLAGAAGAFCVLGILLTLSRGALVGCAAALVAAVMLAGRRRLPAALLALLIAGVVVLYFSALAGPTAQNRILAPGDGSGRTAFWNVALRMVEDRPVTGVGTGNFKASINDYFVAPGLVRRSERVLDQGGPPHNIYLQVLAELGAVGLALFVALIVIALRSAVRAARVFERHGDGALEAAARGIAVAIAGLLAAGFFGSWLVSKVLWLVLAFAVALTAVAARRGLGERPS